MAGMISTTAAASEAVLAPALADDFAPGLLYPATSSSAKVSTGFPRRNRGRLLSLAPLSDVATFAGGSAFAAADLESSPELGAVGAGFGAGGSGGGVLLVRRG